MASRDDGGHGSVVALRPDNVSVLRPAEQLFDDMLARWAGQQSSRLLSSKTIGTREAQVRRFAGFCAASPWEWAASDVEEWTTELLSGPRPLTPSTIRAYQNSVALFCSYLTDARYGWVDRCMELFGTHPVQVCIALSYGLTERECQVAMQCVQGRVTKEIARALFLSPYTVQDHLKSIFDKTGVRSRGELVGQIFLDHYATRWESPAAATPGLAVRGILPQSGSGG